MNSPDNFNVGAFNPLYSGRVEHPYRKIFTELLGHWVTESLT